MNQLNPDDPESWPDNVEYIVRVFADWSVLTLENGDSFGFNREEGTVYKLPHEDCPFLTLKPERPH